MQIVLWDRYLFYTVETSRPLISILLTAFVMSTTGHTEYNPVMAEPRHAIRAVQRDYAMIRVISRVIQWPEDRRMQAGNQVTWFYFLKINVGIDMDIDDACVCGLCTTQEACWYQVVRILIDKTGKCSLIAWTKGYKTGKDTKDEGPDRGASRSASSNGG